ncbi:hypothetical protein PMIN02_008132 [Paraphaeosphaeria minitans]
MQAFTRLLAPFTMSRSRMHHDTRATTPATTPATKPANKEHDAPPHKEKTAKTRSEAKDGGAKPSRQKQKNVNSSAQVENDEANEGPQKEKIVELRTQIEDTGNTGDTEDTDHDEVKAAPQKDKGAKTSARAEAKEIDEVDAAPPKQVQDKHRTQAEKNKPEASPPKQKQTTTPAQADVSPIRKGERIRHAPKLAEGMVYHEHPNTKYTYKIMSSAKPIAVDHSSDEDAAPSKPTTARQKTLAKTAEEKKKKQKKESPSRMTRIPGLEARRKALEKQARREMQSASDIEIEEQVTERTAKMADRLAALTKLNQELWLESQMVLDEFLGYVAYVGDEEDVGDAQVKFDRVRKRKIRGETYDWPVAKRVREGSVHD